VGLERPRLIEQSDLRLPEKFDCGTEPVLNEWLRVHAWTNHQSGSARVYVSIDTDAHLIAGFYCLSAGSVEYADAPARLSKGLARHPVPVVLIGRLAVDRRYVQQGLGRLLMQDAYHHVVQTADAIGTRAVIVQAKTEDAAEFYRRLGFEAFSSEPMLFFQLVKDVTKSGSGSFCQKRQTLTKI
jgi:GNAT superfamily N-acetyltransferase